jgi:hypothetical protein
MKLDAEQTAWMATQVPALEEHWLLYLFRTYDERWMIHAQNHRPTLYASAEDAEERMQLCLDKRSKYLAGYIVRVPSPALTPATRTT